MKPSRKTRKLAVPFVLTLSALPACKGGSSPPRSGCEPPECHMNPPPPPPPSATTAETAKPPLAVAAGPKLCAETGDKRPCVRKQGNGSCVLVEDDHCPPNAKCNPPEPRPVACP